MLHGGNNKKMWQRRRISIAALLLCTIASGCQTVEEGLTRPIGAATILAEPISRVQSASTELGRDQFRNGNFALAERSFREAVEADPNDSNSWVSLAASYDKLGRFELADRAYARAIETGGETTEVLNNLGYSYLLRGDQVQARAQFERALQLDPSNPVIFNNIRLLSDGSVGLNKRLR
jgi:Flp pilus assembly protein TadD